MNSLWLLPLLPFLGCLLCGALHLATLRARRDAPDAAGPSALAGLVACAAMGGALAVGLLGLLRLRALDHGARVLESSTWSWIDTGSFSIDVSMVLDPLSSVMVLVICGVGLLIHIYSLGYMRGDPGFAKFFCYLNLFVAAMLVLVLSSSLPGLFVGWEGVGLCSYLLIGFWYEKGWPAEAGQKAFVVNRIGDACFLLGTFLLARTFGTLDLSEIGGSVAAMLGDPARAGELALAALLLFGGACGKSAQFPLFTWLPDAMAGPTPVSALIHAATMVTAGVYLVVRMNPLFAASPGVLFLIGCAGALTAVIGATTALRQRDIKKVLAYSTVSQLGYMFLALGSGAFVSAIFHLVTHAFFKGLLFLGAGSVIHGMHDEQDMYRMGGLAKHMPKTWITFVAGAIGLSGIPPFSGFVSKDEILGMAFNRGFPHLLLWALGLGAAALTAYYTWRMVALTFHGEERFDAGKVHPHESPSVMTLPLMVLAVLALAGGLLGLPHVLHMGHLLEGWLEPVVAPGLAILHGESGAHHLSVKTEWILLGVGSLVALFFAHRGFHENAHGTERDERFEREHAQVSSFFGRAWGIDTAYQAAVVRPLKLLSFLVATLIDQFAIDGAVNGAAAAASGAARRLRAFVDGSINTYALWMGAGAAVLALLWIAT